MHQSLWLWYLQQIRKKSMSVRLNNDQAGLIRPLLVKAVKTYHIKFWNDVLVEVTKDHPELSFMSEINANKRMTLFGNFEDLVRDVDPPPKRARRLGIPQPNIQSHDDILSP
jgi:hypothetical protein